MSRKVPLESDKPFFSRHRTKSALADLAYNAVVNKVPLTVYAGAGVTIDRSGLGWRGMVDGLLERYVEEPPARDVIFAVNDLEAAATLTEGFYQRDYGDQHFRDRMIDRLRWMLYAPGDWRAGRLADEIGGLCDALRVHGSGVIVATPNYDDYLADALAATGIDVEYIRSTEGGSPLSVESGTGAPKSASWVNSSQQIRRLFLGGKSVLHLHGLIPRDPTKETFAPVVSEIDYIDTAPYTYRALRALLSRSGLLMVGTSMTDGPLLRALEKTKDSGYPRYAIMPLGIHLDGDPKTRAGLRQHQLERFARFGVTPVYVDYHFQIAQFVAELARLTHDVDDKQRAKGADLFSGLVDDSYGKRLIQWSSDWKSGLDAMVVDETGELPLAELYNNLQQAILDDIRDVLELSASEIVKLEIWVRDSPSAHRGLRLWSSTVSRHFQEASARRADFENSSEIAAVRAFVEGRPSVYTQAPERFPSARWNTYFATPIWLGPDGAKNYGSLPVGSVVIASRRAMNLDDSATQERGKLVQQRRREAMKEATTLMSWLGQMVTSTAVLAQGRTRSL